MVYFIQLFINICSRKKTFWRIKSKTSFHTKKWTTFIASIIQVQRKFDLNKHGILSFDAVSLFTKVNTELVVDYICEIINKSPTKNFVSVCVKNENNRYKIQPRNIFKKVFSGSSD